MKFILFFFLFIIVYSSIQSQIDLKRDCGDNSYETFKTDLDFDKFKNNKNYDPFYQNFCKPIFFIDTITVDNYNIEFNSKYKAIYITIKKEKFIYLPHYTNLFDFILRRCPNCPDIISFELFHEKYKYCMGEIITEYNEESNPEYYFKFNYLTRKFIVLIVDKTEFNKKYLRKSKAKNEKYYIYALTALNDTISPPPKVDSLYNKIPLDVKKINVSENGIKIYK